PFSRLRLTSSGDSRLTIDPAGRLLTFGRALAVAWFSPVRRASANRTSARPLRVATRWSSRHWATSMALCIVSGRSSRTSAARSNLSPPMKAPTSASSDQSRTRQASRSNSLIYSRKLPAPTQPTVVAQFRDYHAEKFSGQGDPRIVDEWIQGLEFIFEDMECPDRYRVVCAQLQLTGDARLWWNAYWSMRPGEKAGCTWDMFKDVVREKYYPSYYRAEMERQFLALQQGTRTVDEYEREFTRLAGF
ncbi:Unknown protein, partial [Striga hermonthica]